MFLAINHNLFRRLYVVKAIFLFALFTSANIYARPLGVVLDVTGKVNLSSGEEVSLLKPVNENDEITLEANSQLVISFYPLKSQYTAHGPSKISIKADKVSLLQGTSLQQKSLADKPQLIANRVLDGKHRQASLVIRGDESHLFSPSNRTAIKTLTPMFKWPNFDGKPPLKLVIIDNSNQEELFTANVVGNEYQLTEANKLEHGKTYTWYIAKEGAAQSNTKKHKFEVLSERKLEELSAYLSTSENNFADKVMLAGYLESIKLFDDAKAIWKELSDAHPDVLILKEVAKN